MTANESREVQMQKLMVPETLTRRSLIARMGVIGLMIPVLPGLLAACADDDDTVEDVGAEEPADESDDEADSDDDADDTDEATDDASAPESEGQHGGSLHVAMDRNPQTLDPHLSSSRIDRLLYTAVYEKLMDIDEDLNFVPELATDWEVSDDGLEYTFSLAEGINFHDGEPFNAEAAKYNFDRMTDPDIAQFSPRAGELAQVDEAHVDDEYTLRLTLNQQMSPLLATLTDRAGMMISPTALEELGDDLQRQPVGTGPFTFVEWVTDDRIVFERNDHYWKDGLPYLDEVVFRPIPDHSVLVASLRSNEIQVLVELPGAFLEDVENDPSVEVSEAIGLGFEFIDMNNARPPFDDMLLRQAVALTIDRDLINEAVWFGTAEPAHTYIPPSSWAFDDSVRVYEQDYDAAREKLSEAGHADGFEFTLISRNSPLEVQLTEVIQTMMSEAGIIANIEVMDGAARGELYNQGDFEMLPTGWSGRPDPDGNVYNFFHSEGGANRAQYSNEQVDRLLEESRAVTDQDDRKQLYSEAITIITEEAGSIPLVFPPQLHGLQPTVRNFSHVPDGLIRVREVWLDD